LAGDGGKYTPWTCWVAPPQVLVVSSRFRHREARSAAGDPLAAQQSLCCSTRWSERGSPRSEVGSGDW